MTLHALQRSLKGFDIRQEVIESLMDTKREIVRLNQNQLLRGRDSLGNYLSPKYSEDPYFKNPGAWERYAKWKAHIDKQTDKPFDVSNLYITGRFHRNFGVEITRSEYSIFSQDANAGKIEAKFTDKIYGMDPESKGIYIGEFFFPDLKRRIETKTGLKLI